MFAFIFRLLRWGAAGMLLQDIVIKLGVNLEGVNQELIARVNAAQVMLRGRGLGLRVTSANDGNHVRNSLHYSGHALDLTPANRALGWKPEERARIVAALKAQGLRVLDEYASPSAKATGGHLHVELRA